MKSNPVFDAIYSVIAYSLKRHCSWGILHFPSWNAVQLPVGLRTATTFSSFQQIHLN